MSALITNGYAAKRAIIAHLAELAARGIGALGQYKAKVSYGWEGGTGDAVQVFGGLVSFTQPPGEDDLQDGDDILPKEFATISLHIRVLISPPPADGIAAVEEVIEEIGDQVADELARNRHLAGGSSVSRIIDGVADQEPADGGLAARMTMHIQVESYLVPEPV